MKIGILTTGRPPEDLGRTLGSYPAMFERLFAGEGFTFTAWPVLDGAVPEGPEAADGWLITGSRHGVYDDLPWIPPLEALIRDIADTDRPLVGICFGHQAMAQALGGLVEKHSGGWTVGKTAYDWHDGTVRYLNAWHQDQVVTPPQIAETLASNATCRYAALRYSPTMMSVQAHPEFGDRMIAGLLETRAPGVVPAPLIETARARLGGPDDAPRVAGELAQVLRRGGEGG